MGTCAPPQLYISYYIEDLFIIAFHINLSTSTGNDFVKLRDKSTCIYMPIFSNNIHIRIFDDLPKIYICIYR